MQAELLVAGETAASFSLTKQKRLKDSLAQLLGVDTSQVGILRYIEAPAPSKRRRLQAVDDGRVRVRTDQPPHSSQQQAMSIHQLIAQERSRAAEGGKPSATAPADHHSLRALLPAMQPLSTLAKQGAFDRPESLLLHASNTDVATAAAAGTDSTTARRLQMLIIGEDGSFQQITNASRGDAAAETALRALSLLPRPGPGGDEVGGAVQDEGEDMIGIASESPEPPSPPASSDVGPDVQQAVAAQQPVFTGGIGSANTTRPGQPQVSAPAYVKQLRIITAPRGFKGRRSSTAAQAAASSGLHWQAGTFGRDVPLRGFSKIVASALVSQRMGRGQVRYVDADGNASDAPSSAAGTGEQVHAFAAEAARRSLLQVPPATAWQAPTEPDAGSPAAEEQALNAAVAVPAGGGGRGVPGLLAADRGDITEAFKRLKGPRTLIVGPHREGQQTDAGDVDAGDYQTTRGAAALQPAKQRRQLKMLFVGEDGSLQPITSGAAGGTPSASVLQAIGGSSGPQLGQQDAEAGSQTDQASAMAVASEEANQSPQGAAAQAAAAAVQPFTAQPRTVNAPPGFKGSSSSSQSAGSQGGTQPAAGWQGGSYGAAGTGPLGGFSSDDASALLQQQMGRGAVMSNSQTSESAAADPQSPGSYGGEQLHAYATDGGIHRRSLQQTRQGSELAASRRRRLPQQTSSSPVPCMLVTVKVSGFASSTDATTASLTLTDIISNGTLAASLAEQGWADAQMSLLSLVTGSVTPEGSATTTPRRLPALQRSLLIAIAVTACGLIIIGCIVALVVHRMRRSAATQLAATATAAAAAQRHSAQYNGNGGSSGAFQHPRSKSAYTQGYYPPGQEPLVAYGAFQGADGYTQIAVAPAAGGGGGSGTAGHPPQQPIPGASYPPIAGGATGSDAGHHQQGGGSFYPPVGGGGGGGSSYPAPTPTPFYQQPARASAPPAAGAFYPAPSPTGQRQMARLAVPPPVGLDQWGLAAAGGMGTAGYPAIGGEEPTRQQLAGANSRGASPRGGSAVGGAAGGFGAYPMNSSAGLYGRSGTGGGGSK